MAEIGTGEELGRAAVRNGGVTPMIKRAAVRHWNAAKEGKFLDHLAVTCNVAASLRAAGMSYVSAYRHRKRSAHFRAGWDSALAEGYSRLEAQLLDRALNGRRVTVERDGQVIETIEYSDKLALHLLAQHRKLVAEVRAANSVPREDPALVRARIADQIMTVVGALADRSGDVAVEAGDGAVEAGDGGGAHDASSDEGAET